MEATSLPRQRSLGLPRSRRLLAAFGDGRLVDELRRGNDAAFEAIFDRHHRGILGFCRHMVGSHEEAEDAVQHVFAQAYDNLRRDDREMQLKPWLYTIARNRCLSVLRARREDAEELGEIETAGLGEQVERRSDLRELLEDMHELPEDQRAALVLSELGDLSHADIADVLGCEAVKVKALVFQARSTLIESRNARAIPCTEIREQLATLQGGALRRGALRKHLRVCSGCSDYRDQVRVQRQMLAVALPVIPSVGLKASALGAVGLSTSGSGVAAGGGAVAGGAAAASSGAGAAGGGVAAGSFVKLAAVMAAAAAAAGGGVAITSKPAHHHVHRHPAVVARTRHVNADRGSSSTAGVHRHHPRTTSTVAVAPTRHHSLAQPLHTRGGVSRTGGVSAPQLHRRRGRPNWVPAVPQPGQHGPGTVPKPHAKHHPHARHFAHRKAR